VVLNKPRRTHSTELLQSLHWLPLPVKERIDYKVALLAYKVYLSSTPDYQNNLLSQRVINSSVTLHSSSRLVLHLPRSQTVCGTRAFSIAAPTVWNKFPADVQLSNSVTCSKSRLETFLFWTAYSCWAIEQAPLYPVKDFTVVYNFILHYITLHYRHIRGYSTNTIT